MSNAHLADERVFTLAPGQAHWTISIAYRYRIIRFLGANLQSVSWCAAESLAERIAKIRSRTGRSLPAFDVDHQSHRVSERAKRWRSQLSFINDDLFAQRLAAVHISEEEFLLILDDRRIGCLPAERPPAWRREFDVAYSTTRAPVFRLSDAAPSLPHPAFSFLYSVEPLLDHFVFRLIGGVKELAREYDTVPFDAEAVHLMFVGSMLEAFQSMLTPTMVLQLHLARLHHELRGESPSERFQSFVDKLRDRAYAAQLLSEYPVLARQLVGWADRWVASNLTFLRHLLHDWRAICSAFGQGGDPGPIVGIQAHAGDTHRGGRSVLIARFGSGLRIVYKPRSLQTDLHFQELVAWINDRAEDLTLKTLIILDRGSHGWVEFIAPSDCESKDGVRRFYERQGGYLALFYLLNGSDFHCENIIASGEHPVVVDVEALFHPNLIAWRHGIHGIAAEYWANSVLHSGFLPVPTRLGETAERFDRSGLGATRSQMSPFALLYPEDSGTDEMKLARRRMMIRPPNHLPIVDGRPVEKLDGDAIIRGFKRVYRAFLAHRKDLLDQSGPIARFRNDEVRLILRHTRAYTRLLAESFHPDLLRDALDRDRMFDLLWDDVPRNPHLCRVATRECQDLWNGDVPIFNGRVGSRDLFLSTGECIRDFLTEPNDALVFRRIEMLDEADLEKQVWLIRASLMALGSDRTTMSGHLPTAASAERSESDYTRLITQARRIGDRLERLAIRSQTHAGWMGLSYDGRQDWSVRPLGFNLYEGTAGIVLFLAYLATITKEERYQRLALAGAANLRTQALSTQHVERAIGAFTGGAGLLYVYSHLAALWNRREFIDEAHSVLDSLCPFIDDDKIYDIVGGAAGFIACLLSMHTAVPSDALASAAIRCGDHLIRSAQRTEYGLAWSTRPHELPLGGFSHGVSGIAWSLLALSRISGEPRFNNAALAALEYERSLFDAQKGHWADLRKHNSGEFDGEHSHMAAWCHGAAGIGLAQLCLLEGEGESTEIARQDVTQAVKTTLALGFGYNHSLCHGDLGNLDFILQSSEAMSNDAWRTEVSRITKRILYDVEHNGWKCGIGTPIETPGLMAGLAGIGYGMLRLAEPRLVPSVLTLAPPVDRLRYLPGTSSMRELPTRTC